MHPLGAHGLLIMGKTGEDVIFPKLEIDSRVGVPVMALLLLCNFEA